MRDTLLRRLDASIKEGRIRLIVFFVTLLHPNCGSSLER